MVVKAGLGAGLQVTAFVRDASRLKSALSGSSSGAPDGLRVVEGDAAGPVQVAELMAEHEAVVNAAGSSAHPEDFHRICRNVVSAAEAGLAGVRRLWMFGGIAALDVPGRDIMLLDCPGVPSRLRVHSDNLALLRGSSLDWSLMCPGPMSDGPAGELTTSIDILPFRVPVLLRHAPRALLSVFALSKMGGLTVSYASVARLIADELGPNGRFSRHRVGVAPGTLFD